MATDSPQPPLPQEPKPAPGNTPGPIERGLLGVLLAAGVLVSATVALSDNLSPPERILGVSFSLLWISLAGMTVRVWGEPQLRGLYFTNPIGSNLTRLSRFVARYRDRFGADLWSTLFRWSSAVTLLSALYLAATKS